MRFFENESICVFVATIRKLRWTVNRYAIASLAKRYRLRRMMAELIEPAGLDPFLFARESGFHCRRCKSSDLPMGDVEESLVRVALSF